MITSHAEIIRKLRTLRTYFDKILKKSASIAYELNTQWDSGISFIFSRDDAPQSPLCALVELPSFTADPLRGPVPPLPPWFWRDILVLLYGHHLGLIEMLREGSLPRQRRVSPSPGETMRTSLVLVIFLCFSLFLSLVVSFILFYYHIGYNRE